MRQNLRYGSRVSFFGIVVTFVAVHSVFCFVLWLNSLSLPGTKIAEFANGVDLDEVAHIEPPHLDLHCLHSSLLILIMIRLELNIFF